ncbi:MAG TPA: hypothetical protein P5125_06105 [Kiritimatiellia bacterium]|jgi:hypothetical protein|nr:hypothetical protein [Kiritimatiellia bacterium]HOR98109.1 hypothetical protein [Kiritimatiellia bacterium]HRU19913.1 hypothetical protein [Kiritimatiellia bacterium]
MKTRIRPFYFLHLASSFAFVLSANALTVTLSADPELPAPNILTNGFFRFDEGLKGWANSHSNEVCCIEMEGRGLSFFTKDKKSVWRSIPTSVVKPGRTYILSCEIKPSSKVNTHTFSNGGSGLGCGLTYWSEDWKRAVSLCAYTDGPDRWFRTYSQPVTMPDWIIHGQMTVGLAYSGGSGYVDNIELVEAYSELTICAESQAAIRQVKVVDHNFRTVYDSGVLNNGAKTWTHRLQIEAAYKYAVFAVDAVGNVSVVHYPAKKAQE